MMKTIKRWTTSIATSFDWMISQVENHEALVSSAIRDMQQASAKAKVQLNRVKKDGAKMKERLGQLEIDRGRWEERALAVHAKDPEKALECVKRKKRIEKESVELEAHIKAHAKLEKQLTQDLDVIHARITELKRKKNAFAARQFRAQAVRAGEIEDIGLITEIDEIFDRWDVKLEQVEPYRESDDLEDEFINAEEAQELQAELDALVSRSAQS